MAEQKSVAGEVDAKLLVERLIGVSGDDHERFLLKIKNRFDRVGMELPTIEVRAEGLAVDVEAYAGTGATPNIINSTTKFFLDIADTMHVLPSSRKIKHTILHKTSAVIRPRRMTLLLGSPGSGKTTLLKALAGKLDLGLEIDEQQVSGRVTYNGHGMDKFVPERTAAYISQDDLHSGEMTVRETLAFSASCQGNGYLEDILTELIRRERESNIMPEDDIDMFMKVKKLNLCQIKRPHLQLNRILGLHTCADTLVGNDMARGISGGQRKRVTIGEMLVGPARALFMDEISNGLDSTTAFQMVNYLKQSIHILGGTAVISLLQPTPETYDLFDDIILLSEGHVVYQGSKENVLEFFESLGFNCPQRKAVADFLLEVTSRKDQQQYWSRECESYQYFTVEKFSDAFHAFHTGLSIRNVLEVPFDKNLSSMAALTTSKYGVRKRQLFKSVFAREVLLMKRNPSCYIANFAHITLISFTALTIFWRSNMRRDSVSDGGIYLGMLFFTVSETMFSTLGDLGGTIMKLPLFFKQRDVFYPAWAYTLPTWILKIPITFIDVTIWVAMTYYGVGFDPSLGRFFKQYVLLLAISQMSSSLFRTITGVTRNMFTANIVGTFIMLLLLLLSGFILSSDNLNKFWMLGYWISPLMYAQNAISTNEFTAGRWSKIIPGSTESLGTTVLKSRSLFVDAKWYRIGLGALIGYTFLFNGLYTTSFTYFKASGRNFSLSTKALDRKPHKLSNDAPSKIFDCKRVANESWSSVNIRRVTLPFVPLSLTFENVRYSVDMPKEKKARGETSDRLEILKGVSGAFRPGVLTALMGMSGAGKTTLLDVLAGRKTGGYTEGTINISGYRKKEETFCRVFGYCEQSDIHSPYLTVLESLVFSAWLRLPSEINSIKRKMFVDDVMELLELTSLQTTLVGHAGGNGLSNEQRKRLTIAVELVANPSIIFMDEPTSGLDARAASIVMRTVRNLADTGKTVVCTIHQPSIDIFETFDELILLNRGGEEIYVGPLGECSSQMIKYFEEIEGVKRIKDGYNPATWMLEVTSTIQEQEPGINLPAIYKDSELYQRNQNLIRDISMPPPCSTDLHFPNKYAQSFFKQCVICFWKQNLSYWRNIHYTGGRYFITIVIALLIGTNASGIQPVVAMERIIFYKERTAGMYSALPYTFAQVAIELPYIFIQTLIYGVLVYTMIGFEWMATKFFWYLFFMYFTLLYFTLFGMMSVGLAPDGAITAIISSAFYGFWNLFSGFLIPINRIPVWSRWCYWICPVAWTLYGLGASQFGDVEEKLETGETVAEFLRSYYGFRHELLGVVAAVIMAFAVAFAFLFGFSVKYINFQRK
ncbi:hypothetical protein EJB05_15634, partial [Eragrostis curvula]